MAKSRLIAAPPALVQTLDTDVHTFLSGLSAPDFTDVADAKALWATAADETGEGTAEGTTYVVSAEAYKYVKARRF